MKIRDRTICTGVPKSGTHMLEKIVRLLGNEANQGHIEPGMLPPAEQGKVIMIKRNPRNVMVSWLRHNSFEITAEQMIEQMKTFYAGKGVYDTWAAYEPYQHDGTLIVSFENLIKDPNPEVKRITDYLGKSPVKDLKIIGNTRTYTGRHSVWQEHWNDKIEKAWIAAHGHEVESMWGYYHA